MQTAVATYIVTDNTYMQYELKETSLANFLCVCVVVRIILINF